jgi:hypothetical protein
VNLRFWEDTVRGQLYIHMYQSGDEPSDTGRYHDPLSATFPADDCGYLARAIGPEEPSPVLAGGTLRDLHAELIETLDELQPTTSRWASSGDQTQVSVELGTPVSACEFTPLINRVSQTRLDVTLPIRIDSSDGRVKIRATGMASVAYDAAGVLEQSVILAGDDRLMIPVSDFPARSGISGVDLSGLTRAGWMTSVWVFHASESADSTVDIRGERDGALVPWDSLRWRY